MKASTLGHFSMRIAALIAISALLFAGCSSSPPLPTIESKRGDRIGVLVDIGDSPTHTHVGTTVFNNFTKKYPYAWNLNSEIARTVHQAIRNSGLTPVDLRLEGIQYADVSELIQAFGEKWQVGSGKEEAVRRLRDQLKLKALLVLKEGRVMTALECAGGPCSERYADASGLYTRSFFGSTRYHAVAAFHWNFFVLDPVADAAKADPLRSMLRIPATPLLAYKDPATFDNLTEPELSPVRDAIVRFSESAVAEILKILNTK